MNLAPEQQSPGPSSRASPLRQYFRLLYCGPPSLRPEAGALRKTFPFFLPVLPSLFWQ